MIETVTHIENTIIMITLYFEFKLKMKAPSKNGIIIYLRYFSRRDMGVLQSVSANGE